LQTQELLIGEQEDPYFTDHPLTQERIGYVRAQVERSPYSNVPDPPSYLEMLQRIKVKLAAFTQPPASTLAKFAQQDRALLARYARAIAYSRIPDLDKAMPAIDALIRDYPRIPYFRELKGQMLFENGRTAEAVQPYEQAVRLDPRAPLLRIELAQVYLENHDPVQSKQAIGYETLDKGPHVADQIVRRHQPVEIDSAQHHLSPLGRQQPRRARRCLRTALLGQVCKQLLFCHCRSPDLTFPAPSNHERSGNTTINSHALRSGDGGSGASS
jgi:tetratricopeptide (TPR) repeat protein